jgi:hypothetical protein
LAPHKLDDFCPDIRQTIYEIASTQSASRLSFCIQPSTRAQVEAMKLHILLIVLAFADPSHQYKKVTAMFCNTTGQTFINMACRIRPLNRTHTMFQLGGELIKTVPDYFVSSKVRSKVAVPVLLCIIFNHNMEAPFKMK